MGLRPKIAYVMKFKVRELRAGSDDSGRRLDRVLRAYLRDLPLGALHRAIRRGDVRVNGIKARAETLLAEGDALAIPERFFSPEGEAREPAASSPSGLDILFENEDLLAIDKPRGLLAHGEGGADGIVRDYLRARLPPSLSFAPGPLHRLDRNTTGILCFSKSLRCARAFSGYLRARALGKYYLAELEGDTSGEEEWADLLERPEGLLVTGASSGGGRKAESRMRPCLSAGGRTLALIELRTGLTHQIRAQAALRGCPLAGDLKYGGGPRREGYFLRAVALVFPAGRPGFFPPSIVAPPFGDRGQALAGRFGAGAEAGIIDAIAQYCRRGPDGTGTG
jgi:23S rRNA pseudouridine955/2504/2580 synthase